MTIPALRALRLALPDASLALETRSWAVDIFRDADFIDEIVIIEENDGGIRSLVKQSRRLGNGGFDLAVLFTNSYRSAAAVKLAGIPRRFGYAKEGRRFLLTDALRIPKWKETRHEVFYYLEIAKFVERRLTGSSIIADVDPIPRLYITPEQQKRGAEILNLCGCDLSKPVIALGAGSTNSRAKRWPQENFAKLNDRIQSESGANVVLLGAGNEAEISANISNVSKAKPIDLTGKTGLGEAIAVLAYADLFVSNDMGLAHIAAATGTPTITIFGPTNPLTTHPFAENSIIVREPVECSPCMLRDCPIDHRCMTRITVERVLGTINEVLEKKPAIGK